MTVFDAIEPLPLHGVRVWLSSAVPNEATPEQKQSILRFVREFAELVFRADGHIIHGSHPSITPTLLAAAKAHVERGGRKDCLTLAVSRYWSKDPASVPVSEWRETCLVYETEEASGEGALLKSLEILRHWMSERCDAFVAAGGMWWNEMPGRAGVPLEAGLAMERGIPCFVLGGLGGAAKSYVERHPQLLRSLKNGLDDETNKRLALEEKIGTLVHEVTVQLARLPLVKGRVADGVTFRILALDGGGIKGAYTAGVLAALEQALGQPIAPHFDLIAGTSTGGILAIGLGMGMSARQMLDFYRTRGPVIFPVTSFHESLFRRVGHVVHPKYSQQALFDELEAAYFTKKSTPASSRIQKVWRVLGFRRSDEYVIKYLKDSCCRLVIPAYAASGAVHTFRTPHHPLLQADADTSAAEVALATAAAPTYFASAQVRNTLARSAYVDGGVWANNPAMAAIIEAVCYLGVPVDRIDVLSIGTTEEPFAISKLKRSGWVRWARKLITLLMNAQSQSALTHAQALVGKPRFLRIDSMTVPGTYALDGVKEVENLIALGQRAVAHDPQLLDQIKSRFLNGVHAIPWERG